MITDEIKKAIEDKIDEFSESWSLRGGESDWLKENLLKILTEEGKVMETLPILFVLNDRTYELGSKETQDGVEHIMINSLPERIHQVQITPEETNK